jgi:hypothetical protein
MATTAVPPRSRESAERLLDRPARARQLAELLVARAGLRSDRVPPDQMIDALARVLAVTPLDSEHGRLVNAALASRKGRRLPDEQWAVWRLLRRGKAPTAFAVAKEVAYIQQQKAAEKRARAERRRQEQAEVERIRAEQCQRRAIAALESREDELGEVARLMTSRPRPR